MYIYFIINFYVGQHFDATIEKLEEEGEDGVVTKELYLCGTCSEGFASIQECKAHMLERHDVVEFQNMPAVGQGKVDAGTQMERKKRGRKKKVSETVQADEEEKEEEKIQMSESDEDWVENLHSHSTRSHRKRRPPQALKKDYYLGRTKKKETKKKEGLPWGEQCDVKGCGRTFESAEILMTHQEFHIKEREGFAGPMYKYAFI